MIIHNSIKASVIIPTKNPGAIFRSVLSRVLEQQAEFSFDVLVIDSGSTDGTREFVRGFADSRLSLMEITPAEFGHGKTRNLGIASTSGEYAILITHDATPISDRWLATMVDAADHDSQIAGVFGRHVAYPDANALTTHELELHFSGFLSQPVVQNDDPGRYAADAGYRQFLHFFSDNNALVRRSVWENIPYPDVDFAEDQIWAKHIIEAGWKKAYSYEAAVFHSHDYGLFERLQRSFDESYAFLRLFGYELCPSVKSLIKGWLALCRRDFFFLYSTGKSSKYLGEIIRMPIDNFMRIAGQYLGGHGNKLPERVKHFISRDRQLLTGFVVGKL